ncbi:MAG: serine/threonine-protein kinase [Deltaproteobacteria bacterium]|nr:serine/threonine-protein kinase [Deltaproteobacteria bacterium]
MARAAQRLRPWVAAGLAWLLAALPAAAGAERRHDDIPARTWRTLRRVPRQLGVATGRALRELEAGVEQGRRELDRLDPPARPPALPPDPERAGNDPLGAALPPDPGAWDPALDPLFDGAPAPEPAAARAAPAALPPAPHASGTNGWAAGLAALLATALAGAWLTRRRRPSAGALAAAPAPPEAAPPPPPAHERTTHPRDPGPPPARERTTRPRDPAPVPARPATAAAAAERPTPFPVTGRYELLAEIGRGGMGVVYRARDRRLDRIVALKRLPESMETRPRAVQLLLREARSAARLNHPHIVTVYDVDHEDGAYFLTMEYLEGQPLSSLLARRGRFPAAEVAWLGRQAAAGLGYAHERGIVHRDVKTANLFLTRGRIVKVMDFGLAKVIDAVRRRATRIGGTPDYMAPEQTLGLEVDGRADLYALGATLHELLTGRVLFEEGDAMRHHRETPPPDPRERAPGTPAALAELVLELLAKEPRGRPGSAAEVAERLRAIELAAAPRRVG